MANNAEYNDKQNVAAALVEYRELEFGRNYSIAGKNGYIGNLSQVYDNVNGHEEQFFIFNESFIIPLSYSR